MKRHAVIALLGTLLAVPGLVQIRAQRTGREAFTDTFPVERRDLASTGRNPFFILEPGYNLTFADTALPGYLADRGTGQPTSMFGTYIRGGELLVYPFFEYYHQAEEDYSPAGFGYVDGSEYTGSFIAREWLIWVAYGITDRLAVEFETAYHINASLRTDPADPSGMPTQINEAGLGDVEGQIRWRWRPEDDKRPEIFSYYETVFPMQRDKNLIGTSAWELKLGSGLIKGFRWGTVTARAAMEYSEKNFALGEMAVEYLKRISSRLRLYAGLEGTGDEFELITEAQVFLSPNIFIKFNNAFGITGAATDWAPEIGVMISIPSPTAPR